MGAVNASSFVSSVCQLKSAIQQSGLAGSCVALCSPKRTMRALCPFTVILTLQPSMSLANPISLPLPKSSWRNATGNSVGVFGTGPPRTQATSSSGGLIANARCDSACPSGWPESEPAPSVSHFAQSLLVCRCKTAQSAASPCPAPIPLPSGASVTGAVSHPSLPSALPATRTPPTRSQCQPSSGSIRGQVH